MSATLWTNELYFNYIWLPVNPLVKMRVLNIFLISINLIQYYIFRLCRIYILDFFHVRIIIIYLFCFKLLFHIAPKTRGVSILWNLFNSFYMCASIESLPPMYEHWTGHNEVNWIHIYIYCEFQLRKVWPIFKKCCAQCQEILIRHLDPHVRSEMTRNSISTCLVT